MKVLKQISGKKRLKNSVPSIISEFTTIKGDVICENSVHVDGVVYGDISCEELIVGEHGAVHGVVTAKNVELYGTLEGKINTNDIFIARTAKLKGDVSHTSLAIEPGAYIEGLCRRIGDPIPGEKPKQDLLLEDSTKTKNK
jgi:cytoskeletal protein CcmA (bactofilin family)